MPIQPHYSTHPKVIAEAVEFLYDLVQDDKSTPRQKLLQNVARQFKLNPLLLRRKFEEQHGTSLEGLRPPPGRDDRNAAREEAELWAKDFRIKQAGLGRFFAFRNDQYTFVHLDPSNVTGGLKAVRVRDKARWQFSQGTWSSILKQIPGAGDVKLALWVQYRDQGLFISYFRSLEAINERYKTIQSLLQLGIVDKVSVFAVAYFPEGVTPMG